MSITVVGSVALDSLTTPFGKVERALGGSASHFSVSASFFSKVNLVGVVGEDFPKEHIDFFNSKSIDLKGLQIVNGKTFFWEGRYDYDLNNAQTIKTELNVFENFSPVLPEDYKNPQILFLANIHPSLQNHVIANAGNPQFIALDTMNLWIETERNSLLEVIGQVNLLTINETEARLLAKTPNLITAAKWLQDQGPQIVVIKRGEYGALLFYEDQIFSAPALPIEKVYDPTGAGDTFAGGMMGYLAKKQTFDFESLKTAVICGSVMSSFNVEKFSCDRLRDLTFAQIQNRFQEFEKLTHFSTLQSL